MKRAKQRKFRHPMWFKFIHPASTIYRELKDSCEPNGVFPLFTGEIGHIDCGIRFIQTKRLS